MPAGRFITHDPVGYDGGLNLFVYAPNTIEWIDPIGLARQPREGRYHGPKPKYEDPGHHNPTSGKFRGGGSKTSIIPSDAEELFKKSIPDKDGLHWYAMDDVGVVHRFGNSNDGKAHWNGDSVQSRGIRVPPEVGRRFSGMKKDCMCGVKKID